MTSELKCPFCGKELVPTSMGDNDTVLYASVWLPIKNCICNTAASKKIWQALIQSQKDLGIARQALKDTKKVCDGCRWCDSNLYDPTPSDGRRIAETINKALEQIEHKE